MQWDGAVDAPAEDGAPPTDARRDGHHPDAGHPDAHPPRSHRTGTHRTGVTKPARPAITPKGVRDQVAGEIAIAKRR